MLEDRNKEFIKNVGNGELYKVISCRGFEYYVVEENGVEVCSTNTNPERMIKHYKDLKREKERR